MSERNVAQETVQRRITPVDGWRVMPDFTVQPVALFRQDIGPPHAPLVWWMNRKSERLIVDDPRPSCEYFTNQCDAFERAVTQATLLYREAQKDARHAADRMTDAVAAREQHRADMAHTTAPGN